MGNPTSDGIYGKHNAKHDCPRPMVGCRYPKCSCDVDEDETAMKENND